MWEENIRNGEDRKERINCVEKVWSIRLLWDRERRI